VTLPGMSPAQACISVPRKLISSDDRLLRDTEDITG
jgi:hypothetical protein